MEENKENKKGKKKKVSNQDKLMVSSNSMYSELRDVRWLYNPVVYSQLSGDFTLMQQRILLGIIEKLQQRIIDSVDAQHKNKSFPDIFEDSELMSGKTIELNIAAADLGIIPEHYAQLEQAAVVLNRITMKYPKFDSKGRVSRYVAATLFPRIEVEKTNSELRRTGTLRVIMLTDNIRDIFTMQHGFVRHVSHIARIALKKRTPRLYIYLSRFKDVGHKNVPYADLVEFLGLTDEYYHETNEGKNPFTSWFKIKQLVLEPVKQEMDKLAKAGEINLSFDYEPIFPPGKSRGTPMEVSFTVKSSEMGEQKFKDDKRINSICNFIDKYLSWCPDLSAHSLRKLLESLPDDKIQEFINFALTDMRRIVERKQPDDVATYVMGVFRKWKRDHIHQSEQLLELFPESSEESTEDSEVPMEIPGQFAEEWKQVLERYDGPLKTFLQSARHYGSFQGYVYIKFPNKELMEAFNEAEEQDPSERGRLQEIMKDILGYSGYILKRGFE